LSFIKFLRKHYRIFFRAIHSLTFFSEYRAERRRLKALRREIPGIETVAEFVFQAGAGIKSKETPIN
jgi:predicted dithiol-disulfide oxidoreductase (DUF899 family)